MTEVGKFVRMGQKIVMQNDRDFFLHNAAIALFCKLRKSMDQRELEIACLTWLLNLQSPSIRIAYTLNRG
jgi:hypothetical protein